MLTCLAIIFLPLAGPAQGEWRAAVLAENEWRYREGNAPPPAGWNQPGYDDSWWAEGPGGIGYGDGDDNTVIGPSVSVYLRRDFEIADTAAVSALSLYADYDDGFVAYLNGVEIARSNLGAPGVAPAFDQLADGFREAQMYQGGLPEAYPLPLSSLAGLLKNGTNTLAVQAHNATTSSSDLSAIFFLFLRVDQGAEGYQDTPSWFSMPSESSNLPLVLIDTYGQGIPDEPKIDAHMGIIDNGPGAANHLSDPFNGYDGRIGIELRGSSSLSFAKKNYGLETRDEDGENNNVSLLGMPRENDWVLHGPYSDKSLMRNVLAFHISSATGRYTPRTRWCELFINNSYYGLYVLMEKIKRDDNRVDIANLRPEDISGDELTGGYIFSIERDDEGPGRGWYSPYTDNCFYKFQDPDHDELAPEQKAYLENFITSFETAMNGPNAAAVYNNYIDVGSWVDYWLATEIYKHIDNYKFSFYMYKRKDSNGGKLHFGPQWDLNLAFGNFDFAQDPGPDGWSYVWANLGYLRPFWVVTLTDMPEIQNRIDCRWRELRQGPWRTDSLMAFIDENAALIEQARVRNFERWPVLGQYVWPNSYVGQDYDDELNFLKQWLQSRLEWMDQNMIGDCSALNAEGPGKALAELHVFPNPFSASVSFLMESPSIGEADLQIVDVLGKEVNRFVLRNRESYSVEVPPGAGHVLFYKLMVRGEVVRTGKLIRQN